MDEKDMHESELNAAQPARRPKKKKRGRAGKVIRKTVKIVVVLVLAVGAGLTLTLAVDELDILTVQSRASAWRSPSMRCPTRR